MINCTSALCEKTSLLLQKLAASKQAEFQKNWCGPGRRNSDFPLANHLHKHTPCFDLEPSTTRGARGALTGRGLSSRMKESMLSVELGFPSLRQTSTVFLTMLTSCQHSQYTFPTYRDGNLICQCNFVWKFLDRHVLGWNIKKTEKTEQTLSPSRVVMAQSVPGSFATLEGCKDDHHIQCFL